MASIERRLGRVIACSDDEVIVRIQQESACGSCHAKEFCCSTDCAERDLTIPNNAMYYAVGEEVWVEGKNYQGFISVLLAFVLPLCLLLLGTFVSIKIFAWGELVAISFALFCMLIYYLIISLLEAKIKTFLTFKIIKKIK